MTHLGASEVRALLDAHGLQPSRALGQNFVIDPNTIDRIVTAAGVTADDQVVEIGPGVGSLTVGLAGACARVVAIELDRHLAPVLDQVLRGRGVHDRVEVVVDDASTIDWSDFFAARPGRWRLVANLPYNVATAVVLRVLDDAPQVSSILVMVQREVGERLAAQPGTAACGIPSVRAQYWATASVVGRVPATVFHPVPRVESVLVRLDRREEVPSVDLERMWSLVRTAFGQRRKMLRRSLAAVVTTEQFASAGIDPSRRPQDLSVAEWVALARQR